VSVIDQLDWLGKALARHNLVVGSGGNISGRDGPRLVISPSGYDVDKVPPDDWAVIDLDSGNQLAGPRAASEWEFHLRTVRARPDAAFVCHAHPSVAIGLISGGADIQAFTPDFVAFVDRIAHVPFIMPAGPELARAVEEAFASGASAVALRNHGVVTVGRTPVQALVRMRCVEENARSQMAALVAGNPRPLAPGEQDAIRNMDVEAYRRKLLGGED